jgi:hypothetical protein
MDAAPLQGFIDDMLSGDRRRQRAAVAKHVADDVAFSHILGKVQGREGFYGIYRLATSAWQYKARRGAASLAHRGLTKGHGARENGFSRQGGPIAPASPVSVGRLRPRRPR